LIVQAYTIEKSRDEQSKLLDLLEVFRDFTEKGKIETASSIITTQIANLEAATRQIETKARALAKETTLPALPNQPNPANNPSTFPSYAATAAAAANGSNATPQNATPQEWTLVGSKPKPKTPAKPQASNRLILVKSPTGTDTNFSSLATRNAFNNAFSEKGIKGPVVASVTKSRGQNLVVTTTGAFSAKFLLEKQPIWEHLVAFKLAQLDEPWHKVVLHGVPTADFNTLEGMALVVEEIKTFNKGLTPIGTPYWLTPAEKRSDQRAGSVAVAFATEEEASRAIRQRLYVGGISVRVEKYWPAAPTTQCKNCQGFGHLDNHCWKGPRCQLCGEGHSTHQYHCNTCHTKGKWCIHLAPKCANCREAHTANTKACEVFLAVKNKVTNHLL
jgi:hypothetical protein